MTDITQLHRALVARVLDSDGTAPPELRRAAFDNAGLSEPMRTLIEKVAHHAYSVTDEDVAAVRAAGLSEDQIFEIVVCAADRPGEPPVRRARLPRWPTQPEKGRSAMRLEILDRGHRLRTKALLALIRLVSRQPVVDAVKLAFYRPDFYGGGDLTHEAMRGPSAWSIGDRELMAAFVSKVNESQFCVAAHSATSSLWYGDHDEGRRHPRRCGDRADRRAAPGDASHARQAHARAQHRCRTTSERVLAEGVSRQQIEDALGRMPGLQHHRPTGRRVRLQRREPRRHERRCPAPLEARLPIGTVVHLERSPAHQVGRTGATPPSGLAPAAVGGAAYDSESLCRSSLTSGLPTRPPTPEVSGHNS